MKIFVHGLKYPDAFAERTASDLVDIVYVEDISQSGVVELFPDSEHLVATDESRQWLREQLLKTIKGCAEKWGQPIDAVTISFST